VLIDSLADLRMAAPDEARFREFIYSLTQRFSQHGVSILMTMEILDLFQIGGDGIVLTGSLRPPDGR
jgi:circadian clock protein KaiC